MKITHIFFCFAIVAMAMSCRNTPSDTKYPVITISAPLTNQVFSAAANVVIAGGVTDNGLHELKITITNTANGAVLYSKTISVHGLTSYTINESWINNVTAITNATVKVEVEDLGSNKDQRTVPVILNP